MKAPIILLLATCLIGTAYAGDRCNPEGANDASATLLKVSNDIANKCLGEENVYSSCSIFISDSGREAYPGCGGQGFLCVVASCYEHDGLKGKYGFSYGIIPTSSTKCSDVDGKVTGLKDEATLKGKIGEYLQDKFKCWSNNKAQ